MTKQNNSILILFIAVLLLASCGNKTAKSNRYDPDHLKGNIAISGAFALYPLAVKWAEDFETIHPDVHIDISAGGAGKGITDALTNTVDLGMVSRELKKAELDKGCFRFAVARDAVVSFVNAHNPEVKNIMRKGISVNDAKWLWSPSSKPKFWGVIAGTGNKDDIRVYTRADACGAAETWAKWFDMSQEDLDGIGVYSDPGLTSAIQKDPLGIGMGNLGYVYNLKTKKPYKDIIVVPVDLNGNGKIDKDEDFYHTSDELARAISMGKYPTPPARNLYLVSHGVPKNKVVIEFIKYILERGQKSNGILGYVPISEELHKKQLETLAETTGADKPK